VTDAHYEQNIGQIIAAQLKLKSGNIHKIPGYFSRIRHFMQLPLTANRFVQDSIPMSPLISKNCRFLKDRGIIQLGKGFLKG
jgi:hypothetical protein